MQIDRYESCQQQLMSNQKNNRDKTLTQLTALKELQTKVKNQKSQLRDTFSTIKDMIFGLASEDHYLQVKNIPEQEMSMKQWILVKTWEVVLPLNKKITEQKKEVSNQREKIQQLADKNKNLIDELEFNRVQIQTQDESEKRKTNVFTSSKKNLEIELRNALKEIELLRNKGLMYEELQKQIKKLNMEKGLLQDKIDIYDAQQSRPVEDARELMQLRKKAEIIMNDKMYLTKENISYQEKCSTLEERLERLSVDLNEAKKKNQEYLEQLLEQKDEFNINFERKITRELNNLKENHKKDMDSTKSNLTELYEKQIQFLNQTQEELKVKNQELKSELNEKKGNYDAVVLENRNLQQRVQSDMSELRLQMHIKTEELDRTQNYYEENLSKVKQMEAERDMYKEKVNLLKAEYYKVEARSKTDNANIRAKLEVMKERLANYENIEKEINSAIERMGEEEEGEGDPNVYLSTMKLAPTSTKRRIQHSLDLAKKLSKKQRDLDRTKKELKQFKELAEQLAEELQVQKNLVNTSNQPQNYLLAEIEQKEKELLIFKRKYQKSDESYYDLENQYKDLQDAYHQVVKDLKKQILRRNEIKQIQDSLIVLMQKENNNYNRIDVKALASDFNRAMNKTGKTSQFLIQPEQPQKDKKPAWFDQLKKQNKKSKLKRK